MMNFSNLPPDLKNKCISNTFFSGNCVRGLFTGLDFVCRSDIFSFRYEYLNSLRYEDLIYVSRYVCIYFNAEGRIGIGYRYHYH